MNEPFFDKENTDLKFAKSCSNRQLNIQKKPTSISLDCFIYIIIYILFSNVHKNILVYV